MLGYVFVVALVAWRCSRKGIEGHEIALVIMLSVIVAICLRQLVGFFRADSPFREPAVQSALSSIVMIRSVGCLLLINSMFNLIPELPSEFHLENGFAGIAVVGLFAVVSIVLLRKPRLTRQAAKLLDASPKEHSFLSFASGKLWFLIPACAIVAVVTNLSMIWSSVGVVMFTDWLDRIVRTLQF